jgi:hypothetical protein
LAADGLPTVGDAERQYSWGDDIRVENLVTELMQPVRLHVDAAGNFVAEHVTHAAGGACAALPIVALTRPPKALFDRQAQTVFDMVDLRPERLTEIVNQIGIPMQFWAAILDMNPKDHRHTLDLLFVALQMLSHVNQFAKHSFACPRPSAYSPAIQPVINPRRFGAFPSGHAAEAYLVARILQRLSRQTVVVSVPPAPTLEMHLQRLAHRIADNRVVAGVHFPIDSTAGRMVGETFAEYFVYRCEAEIVVENNTSNVTGTVWQPRSFIGAGTMNAAVAATATTAAIPATANTLQFDPHEPMNSAPGGPQIPPHFGADAAIIGPGPYSMTSSSTSLLNSLWKKALPEWASFQ